MFKSKMKLILLGLLFLSSMILSGCNNPIPPNEHVGKAPAHNYNDTYYYSGGRYYYY